MPSFSFYRCFLALAALALLSAATLRAQNGYVITKILDNQTARPDGLGNFYVGTPQAMPALDGNTITFQDLASNDNSLWAGSGYLTVALCRMARL